MRRKRRKEVVDLFYDDYVSPTTYDFLEHTKLTDFNNLDFSDHIGLLRQSPFHVNAMTFYTPDLNYFEKKPLQTSEEDNDSVKALKKIFEKRKSTRTFGDQGMTYQQICDLFKLSYYILEDKRRNIASGGGLYPIELFFISMNVEGMDPGVYYYNIANESFDTVRKFAQDEDMDAVNHAFFTDNREDIEFGNIGGYIVFGTYLRRLTLKYQDRGVRFAMVDSGSIMTNVYLAASALDIGVCALGGYLDDPLAELVEIEGRQEMISNAIVVGPLPEEKSKTPAQQADSY
ncbi:MAG: SagB family peptide dehydrogenase [Bacteroidales bacterium]